MVSARRVALVGIIASAALSILNLVVGSITRSTSVLASGFEFAGDVLASGVVFLGLTLAARPADANHPYGHGRGETLAAFVVGLVLVAGGIGIASYSLQAIGATHVPPSRLAVFALGLAIVVRGVMALVKLRTGRRLGSGALVADAWNDAVDVLSAVAGLTAVGLARYDPARFLSADHYGGFVIGVVVVLTGVRVLRDASLDLLDTMPDPSRLDEVRATALAAPGVLGIEKLFARKTGLTYHVDLHLEVDPEMTVAASHDIASDVRRRVTRLTWVADVLVHVEPHRADSQFSSV